MQCPQRHRICQRRSRRSRPNHIRHRRHLSSNQAGARSSLKKTSRISSFQMKRTSPQVRDTSVNSKGTTALMDIFTTATPTQNEVQPGPQPIPGPSLTLIADELRKALYASPEDSWTKPQMKVKDVARWLEEGPANVFLERLGKSAPRQPVPSLPRRPPTPIGGRVST